MQPPTTEPAELLQSTTPRNAYDEVPYSSHPYAHSHPNRLAVISTLFGMTPAPVDRCRVLELGCASGGNLIPVAAEFPESSFVGIDLSSRQIDDGVKLIRSLGLSNIELRRQSITDVDSSWGKFDYIISHGVYSWVPEAVRQKIFEISVAQLNPQGVAYISYNTYPGWHMRGTVRDMMLFHVRKWAAPQDRVSQARSFVDFLAKIVPENDAYSHLLRGEIERLRNTSDNYVLHEHLEAVNEPVLFYDFAQAAAAKGLQFIAEAQSGARYLEALGPTANQMVRQLSRDILEYEQYLDFLQNRMFRRSVLCHADVQLDRNLDLKRIRKFYVASPAILEGAVDPTTTAEAKFRIEGGALVTGAPIVKAAMSILAERWPQAISFDELLDQVEARMAQGPAADREALADALANHLARSFIRQVVELYVSPPKVRTSAGDFPRASELVRLQAATQPQVTTQLHTPVVLNDFMRKLVVLADGSRDRQGLLAGLRQAVEQGELVMVDQTGKPDPSKPVDPVLEILLDKSLEELARLGMWL